MIENYGSTCSPELADSLDELVEHFAIKRQWPRYSSSYTPLLREGLAAVSPARITIPNIKGLFFSSYWPELSNLVESYWSHASRAGKGRDRSLPIKFTFPGNREEWAKHIVGETIIRHGWYGHRIEVQLENNIIEFTIPFFARHCKNWDDGVRRIPEVVLLFEPLDLESLTRTRTYGSTRESNRKRLRALVVNELDTTFHLPSSVPVWLANIAEDYVAEGDTALVNGAPFAATILYGASMECLLAWILCGSALPPNSPTLIEKEKLQEIFTIRKLIADAESSNTFSDETISEMQSLRSMRNGIHANLYSECISMVGDMDAVRGRRLIRKLVEMC